MDDRGFLLDEDATAQDVYSSLHGEEIRTLLLGPGTKGAPISCEMQVVASPKSTQFEALSYVWGDAVQTKSITCNGYEFPVTESLYTALVHLRYQDAWRRLWVDQLCINQAEKSELMEQIASMGTLFSSASRVIVWLGRYDQKMSLAFDLLQEEASLSSSLVRSDFLHSPHQPQGASPPRRALRRRSSSSSFVAKYSSSRASSSTTSLNSRSPGRPKPGRNNSSPALKHALAIFQNVYFDRKWTFQEIVLARAAIICCGDLEMAWSDLSQWYFHYASKLRSSSLLYDSRGSFENIINVRNGLGKGTLRLSNLLMLTRPRMSMKPEDAVYALLGLVPDLAETLGPVSAEREEDQRSQDSRLFHLYLKAFQFCLDRDRNLTILSAAGMYKGNAQVADWPGWLPDWRQQLPLRPLVLVDPAGPGPDAAFDDEEPREEEEGDLNDIIPRTIAQEQPIYRMQVNALPPAKQFPSRHSLTVYGVRLGCIVTRPQAWPNSFFVADSLAQSLLDGEGGDLPKGQGHFTQSLKALAPSITKRLAQAPKAGPMQLKQNYAAQLIQRSLHSGANCRPVRVSAMVESGDWICAFQGGRVCYAIRPIEEVWPDRHDRAQHTRLSSFRGRKSTRGSASSSSPFKGASSPSSTTAINTSPRYHLFLGECAVDGLQPDKILQPTKQLMTFELV